MFAERYLSVTHKFKFKESWVKNVLQNSGGVLTLGSSFQSIKSLVPVSMLQNQY